MKSKGSSVLNIHNKDNIMNKLFSKLSICPTSHRAMRMVMLTFLGLMAIAKTVHTRPNIIIVITDDQGYGEVAAHGNDVIQTPNLDLLHSQSVRLTNFHVDPTCAPTRAALMTGHYSRRTGVWHTVAGRSLLRHDQVTIAQVFARAGYRTAMFGKWHLGDNYPSRPEDRGFQHTIYHGGGGIGQGPDYFNNDYGQYTMDGSNNTSQDSYFVNGVPQKFEGYCTDIFFNEAMEFIQENKDTNFLVYLSTNAPHAPLYVDDSYSTPYKGASSLSAKQAIFYGMITNIDYNMGLLMQQLNDLKLADSTILIFMTDNGSASPAFNAGMRGKKGSEYDGGHRVPFFLRWPEGNLMEGLDITSLTAHIDVFPTLLTLAGIPKPDDLTFDGIDLSRWLRGMKLAWPERKLMVESQRIQTPKKFRRCAVMTERWRLVNGSELFDMSKDLGQKTNVADANASIVADLKVVYDAWWNDVSSRDDEYVNIILGAVQENPTRLMSHDWHPDAGELSVWNQSMVKQGKKGTGWFAVDVAQAGKYQIDLRRWPEEKPGPLAFGTQARLTIGDKEWTKAFDKDNDQFVRFEVDLPQGPTRLQAWLDSDHGAYYTYVQRLSGCMDENYETYDSTATVNDPAMCKGLSVEGNAEQKPMARFMHKGITIMTEGMHWIMVTDFLGKKICRINGDGRQYHDLNTLKKPGIYFFRVDTGYGVWRGKKVLF